MSVRNVVRPLSAVLFAALLSLAAVAPWAMRPGARAAEPVERALDRAEAAHRLSLRDGAYRPDLDAARAALADARVAAASPASGAATARFEMLAEDLRGLDALSAGTAGAWFPLLRTVGIGWLLDDGRLGTRPLRDMPASAALGEAAAGTGAQVLAGAPITGPTPVLVAAAPGPDAPAREAIALSGLIAAVPQLRAADRAAASVASGGGPDALRAMLLAPGPEGAEAAERARRALGVDRLLVVTVTEPAQPPGALALRMTARLVRAGTGDPVPPFAHDGVVRLHPLAGTVLGGPMLLVALTAAAAAIAMAIDVARRRRGGRVAHWALGPATTQAVAVGIGVVVPFGVLPLLEVVRPQLLQPGWTALFWPILYGAAVLAMPVLAVRVGLRRLGLFVGPFESRRGASVGAALALGGTAHPAASLLILAPASGAVGAALVMAAAAIVGLMAGRELDRDDGRIRTRGIVLWSGVMPAATGLAAMTADPAVLLILLSGTVLAATLDAGHAGPVPAAAPMPSVAEIARTPSELAALCDRPRPLPGAWEAEVERAVDGLARPGVRVLVVSGPAGSGKSLVADYAVQRLRTRLGSSVRFAEVRCTDPAAGTGDRPYAAAHRLFLGADVAGDDDRDSVDAFFDMLRGLIGLPSEADDPGRAVERLRQGRRHLVADLVRDGRTSGVLFQIDDLQHMDEASAGLLAAVLAEVEASPDARLAVVATLRDGAQDPTGRLLRDEAGRLEIRYDPAAAQGLLTSRLSLDREAAGQVVAWVDGRNPADGGYRRVLDAVKHLAKVGVLTARGGVWTLSAERRDPAGWPPMADDLAVARRAADTNPRDADMRRALFASASLAEALEVTTVDLSRSLGLGPVEAVMMAARLVEETDLFEEVPGRDIIRFRSAALLGAVRQVLSTRHPTATAGSMRSRAEALRLAVALDGAAADGTDPSRHHDVLCDLYRQAGHEWERKAFDHALVVVEARRRRLLFEELPLALDRARSLVRDPAAARQVDTVAMICACDAAHVNPEVNKVRGALDQVRRWLANGWDDPRSLLVAARMHHDARPVLMDPSLGRTCAEIASRVLALDPPRHVAAEALHFIALGEEPNTPARLARLRDAYAAASGEEAGDAHALRVVRAKIANSLAVARTYAGADGRSEARRLFQESIALKSVADDLDLPGLARSWNGLLRVEVEEVAAIVAMNGDPSAAADAARIAFEAAARHCRLVDDRDGESQSWSHLGELSLLVGAIDAASDAYRRSLEVAVDLPRNRVFSAVGLYRVAIRQAQDAMTEKDVEPAARLLLDALKEAPGLTAVVARKIGEEMAQRPTMGPEEAALQADLSARAPLGRSH